MTRVGTNKIRPTLTKGVAKVPVVMQLEALECGAASLAMVMAYYGKWTPLEQVRSDCGVSRDGSKAKNIYLAAEAYGFDVKAYRKSPESLRQNGQFPCIIHWNMNHFVVLDGFKGKWVYLNDPARGAVKVSWDEFDRSFTGIVLTLVQEFQAGRETGKHDRFRPQASDRRGHGGGVRHGHDGDHLFVWHCQFRHVAYFYGPSVDGRQS